MEKSSALTLEFYLTLRRARENAFSKALIQKRASRVIDSSQERTYRLTQSIMATK